MKLVFSPLCVCYIRSVHSWFSAVLLIVCLLFVLQMKKELSESDSITQEVVGNAHIENYALKMFLYADNEDRSGRFHKWGKRCLLTLTFAVEAVLVFKAENRWNGWAENILFSEHLISDPDQQAYFLLKVVLINHIKQHLTGSSSVVFCSNDPFFHVSLCWSSSVWDAVSAHVSWRPVCSDWSRMAVRKPLGLSLRCQTCRCAAWWCH